jgi:GT2 family glycosyltransferase
MVRLTMMNSSSDIELSIVIISYNTLDMTRACLGSVYEHVAGFRIKVIAVDNDSHDGSAEMIATEFPQATLICNRENKGFASANNQGFEHAEGKYVLLLNSDTVVHADALQQSVKYLEAHPDTGAMGCRVLNSDGSMQRTCSGYPSLSRLLLKTVGLDRVGIFDTYLLRSWERDSEREVETISGCYLMLRKEIID